MRRNALTWVLFVVAFVLFAGASQAYQVGIRVIAVQEAGPDLVVTLKVAQKDLAGTEFIYRWYRWPDFQHKELVGGGPEDEVTVRFSLSDIKAVVKPIELEALDRTRAGDTTAMASGTRQIPTRT